MNPKRRKPLVLLFALLVTLGLSVGTVSEAPSAEAATGETSILNSLRSNCFVQIKYGSGPTYQTLGVGNGKTVPSTTAMYWRYTNSSCKVSSVTPTGIYSTYTLNAWYKVLAGSNTIVQVNG